MPKGIGDEKTKPITPKQDKDKTYQELLVDVCIHYEQEYVHIIRVYLVLSVLVYGLLLVEAGEASVVPLVQLPRVLDRDVHLHTNIHTNTKISHKAHEHIST